MGLDAYIADDNRGNLTTHTVLSKSRVHSIGKLVIEIQAQSESYQSIISCPLFMREH